jgi:uncharacterized membrane protein
MPGLAAVAGVVLLYDGWAIRHKRQTISSAVREIRRSGLLGRVAVDGIIGILIGDLWLD